MAILYPVVGIGGVRRRAYVMANLDIPPSRASGPSGGAGIIDLRNAPKVTHLHLQFFDGNQIPEKMGQENVYHWYVNGNFTYHPIEKETSYLGMWRVTLFIIFKENMPVGVIDIDCQNCELPPYHVYQYSMRHAIIGFNGVLNKASLKVTLNKAEGGPYRI